MTIQVLTSDDVTAPRLVLYGVHGIGKTTFGASLPKPIFMRAEDGMKGPTFEGVARLPLIESWEDVREQLKWLMKENHGYKTLVIDSIDWVERFIHEEVAKKAEKESIADIGYRAGYGTAAQYMLTMLNFLTQLNRKKNMMVVLLGHSKVARFEAPDTEAYDRYDLALDKQTGPVVMQWADAVLFVNYVTFTKSKGDKFGVKSFKGLGDGERRLFTSERPAYHAKNRFGMEPELGFSWKDIEPSIFPKKVRKAPEQAPAEVTEKEKIEGEEDGL